MRVSKMLMSTDEVVALPVSAGFSVSGSSAQPMVRVPLETAVLVEAAFALPAVAATPAVTNTIVASAATKDLTGCHRRLISALLRLNDSPLPENYSVQAPIIA